MATPLETMLALAKQNGYRVTSSTGGTHNPGSLHGSGRAIDIDHRGVDYNALIASMPPGYRVLDERTRPAGQAVWGGPHFHIEYTGTGQAQIVPTAAPKPAPASPAPQLMPIEPDPLAGVLSVGLDGSIVDYGQMAETLAGGNPYAPMPSIQSESLAPIAQQADELFRNRPKPASPFDDALQSLRSVYDSSVSPTGGIPGFLGQATGVAGPAVVGGALGALTGPLAPIAVPFGTALGGAFGTISQGGNEDIRQGRQTTPLQNVVRGAAGATAALPLFRGSTLLSSIGKNAAAGAAIGGTGSAAEQYATYGKIDPVQVAEAAGFGGVLGGATGPFAVKTPTVIDDVAAQASRLAAPGALKALPPAEQARLLLEGGETRLLPGRKQVTTADGSSTFEIETGTLGPSQRLAGDSGIRIGEGVTQPIDVPFQKVEPTAESILQGEVIDALPVETPTPVGPRLNPDGYIDPATITPASGQVFKNRSSAMRGARSLGLKNVEIQPVKVGKGQWMIHKLDDLPQSPPEVPQVGQMINKALPQDIPQTPVVVEQTTQPGMVAPAAIDAPIRMPKPAGVQQAYRGLDPVDSATVHDFDLSATKPGDVVPGLGRFRGFDEDGLPDIARRGGGKRPGESGVAYDAESLPTLLKKAGDLLNPDDVAMIRETLNDIQAGRGSRFIGRAKTGRSSNVAAALDTPATSGAMGNASFDRVLHIEYKPATKAVGKKPGTPAQVRAKVIDSNGQPAIRIIKEAGNPDVGYARTGADKPLENHFPALLDPSKRQLVSDSQIQQAGAIKQAAQGTKHANNPVVQRLDEVIRSNDDKAAQQAIRDLDRLPPEIQKKLGIERGCIK